MNTKRMLIVSVLVCCLVGLIAYQIGSNAAYPGLQTEKWLPKGSITPYTYIVEPYNSTFYGAINHTGYGTSANEGYEFLSTNASLVMNNVYGNLTSGGTVFVSHATYTCDSNIDVANNTITDGDGSLFLFSTNAGAAYGFHLLDVQNVTLTNFEIRYADETIGSFQGARIDASGTMEVSNINVDHVTFENSSYWSMMLKGRVRNLHIENCQFLSVRNYTGRSHIGIYANDGGTYAPCDIWLERNYFKQHSFWIEDATARNMSVRWHINYNTFINVMSDVIPAAGCSDSEIIGNIIFNDQDQPLNNGIDTQYANNVVIMGNTLNRTAATDTGPATASCGIFIGHEAAQGVTIVGNTIEGYDTGVICYGAGNATITSNIISSCTHGIYLGTDSVGMFCNFTIVSNNRIRLCTHWGIEEVNNANINYNVIIGNIVTDCTQGNIRVYGAQTECHLCYNGTSWIS